MSILHDIHALGQSIWYDFISRDFVESGRMKELVDLGVRGLTSNPTIFEQAITRGNDYDRQIRELDEAGHQIDEIAATLFVTDVQNACDVIRPIYDVSARADGYISLEVSPRLAHDTAETVLEARRLWNAVDRPNLMIKIPATEAGLPAIRQCIAEGINVNITLIFSLDQYRAVTDAYLGGLEDRMASGETIDSIHSVASVFVSRIDSLIDGRLEEQGSAEALALRGRAGLANTKLVYRDFQDTIAGSRWRALADHGANAQRPLWASTSTKNPDYPDLLYVDNLIGPDTVNTLPPATLDAVLDHGSARLSIEEGAGDAEETLRKIEAAGVPIADAMNRLLQEGVEKFASSFDSLFEGLEAKREQLREAGIGS